VGTTSTDDEVDCASLFEKTIINSPDPDVVDELKIGDVLHVTLGDKREILVVTDSGDTAGSITSARMLDFINCIEKGFSYVAIVKAVAGGRTDVEIRPESI